MLEKDIVQSNGTVLGILIQCFYVMYLSLSENQNKVLSVNFEPWVGSTNARLTSSGSSVSGSYARFLHHLNL